MRSFAAGLLRAVLELSEIERRLKHWATSEQVRFVGGTADGMLRSIPRGAKGWAIPTRDGADHYTAKRRIGGTYMVLDR